MDLKQTWTNIITSFKQRDFWLMLLASVVVTLLMAAYLLAVGIPKTRARNGHNQDKVVTEISV